jgi:hypothetical protein
MTTTLSSLERRAERIHRTAIWLSVGGLALAGVALSVIDVEALYFVSPPFGLPNDAGGFPTIVWIGLLGPWALALATVVQTPAVAVVVGGMRGEALSPSTCRAARSSAGLLLLIGVISLLSGLTGDVPARLFGAAMIAEAILVSALARRLRATLPTRTADGDEDRGAFVRAGRAIVFASILGFGCSEDRVPSSRSWADLQREIETAAYLQAVFFSDSDRYARHPSELGWSVERPFFVPSLVGDNDGFTATLTLSDDRPLRDWPGVVRCEARGGTHDGVPRDIITTRPRCDPPAPRSGRGGDIGPFWVLLLDGFVTLFLGAPMIGMAVMLGARFVSMRVTRHSG